LDLKFGNHIKEKCTSSKKILGGIQHLLHSAWRRQNYLLTPVYADIFWNIKMWYGPR